MAAGLSQKQINSRVYSRLRSLRYALQKQGLSPEYKNWTVQASSERVHFKAWYHVGNMSNGETVGTLRTHLMKDGVTILTENIREFSDLAKLVADTFKAAYNEGAREQCDQANRHPKTCA